MRGMSRRCLYTIVVVLLLPSVALATYENHSDQATSWLIAQQNSDGSWGANAREHLLYTVEAVQALRALGRRGGAYFKGITWLENHAADNADYGARRARALAAHGDDVGSVIALLDAQQDPAAIGRHGWGVSDSYDQSPLDTAIVLDSLATLATTADVQAGIDYLKGAQLGGGDPGWPVALATASDPFVTALVVRTLTELQSQDPTVASHIADGLASLSTTVDSGSPAHLQALAARAALLAGEATMAQNWLAMLVGGQDGDGSWSGRIYDTALAMRAFATADGTDSAASQSAVAVPDKSLRAAINSALGRNAMDSLDRSELLRLTSLTAFGMAIDDLTGLEWALNLQTADLRDNNITSTAPIDGLPQLATLLLDGNPVADDDYDDGDIPTLPEWGLIIMATLLVMIAAWQSREKRSAGIQA